LVVFKVMKISLDWLSDYVQTGLGAEEISAILSDLGFPLEGAERTEGDVVLDVEVTSNRGDCLGHIGLARELAAAKGSQLKIPRVELAESGRAASDFVSVEIAEPALCGRYTARVIEGVEVRPSPEWMRRRLEAVGIRSVNNVVDATNYAMLETGQPPHAFDYAKIAGGRIVVRRAFAGERIVSIDGSQCELDSEMLVIADGKKPVAIAGVMGGLETEVSGQTREILLEDAYFDPVSVRRTSRTLGLPSEAAFRFERIVDIERIDWASKRTAQLIVEVAGGRAAGGVVDVYPARPSGKEVRLRFERLQRLMGLEVPAEQVVEILSRLHFAPRREGNCVFCVVPSWRSDVYREVDLIEEVARVYGYDKIPTRQKIEIGVVGLDRRQKRLETIGCYLNSCGYYETISASFADESSAEVLSGRKASEHLAVQDVSRKSANLLRQNLLGSLFKVLKRNLNVGNRPCRIFEIANTFVPADGERAGLPIEQAHLALASDGGFRELRGVVEGVARTMVRDAEVDFRPAEPAWARAGAEVLVNGRVVGTAGIVSEAVGDRFDFKDVAVVGAELRIEVLAELAGAAVEVKPLARFPAIKRDLSLVVAEPVRWAAISERVREKAPAELERIEFVDLYRGRGIANGSKSITLSLHFRDADGTLTHEMVDGFERTIVENLAKSLGAELRTV